MSSAGRITAIDRMRGIVMILMASDHAAHIYYRDHIIRDSVMMPQWSDPLPAIPFLHRWLSHLCAPTFVFLAGASIALAAARRAPDEQRAFDRDLILRGLLLIAIEWLFISPLWAAQLDAKVMLQVLYAIGVGMILMTGLRRLSVRNCLIAGIALAVGCEALIVLPDSFFVSYFVTGDVGGSVAVLYPVLPWLSAMLLGHAFGLHLARGGHAVRPLTIGAAIALCTWIAVKLCDGYGNMRMSGMHDDVLRWLQVSKYPPSLAYLALELGIGMALLAGLFALDRRSTGTVNRNSLLIVLGQTALFFYLLHIALLEASGALWSRIGIDPRGSIPLDWLAVAVTVALLWWGGMAFRSLRQRFPQSPLRLL